MATKSETGPRIYEDRVLAYVDILGWKGLIAESATDPSVMKNVWEAMESLASIRRSVQNVRRTLDQDGVDTSLEVTMFSDTVAISCLPTKFAVAWLVAHVRDFCMSLMTDGLYTRGAIVRGPLHHRAGAIFGPALVDAYMLESTVAKYPRIIVDDAVRRNAPAASACDGAVVPLEIIAEDADTLHVLNLFVPTDRNEFFPPRWTVQEIRERVVADQEAHRAEAGIRAKLGWLLKFIDGALVSRER